MNVAILLSGGCGKRFGTKVPKQYLDLCGKPVIEYVVDAVLKAKTIDKIVLVIDNEFLDYVKEKNNPKIGIVPNGKERFNSVKNGLDYIKNSYGGCDNIIIIQAVSPFVTSELIDEYINSLETYDVVTTASKCPGELFDIDNYHKINRNKYYFCQSPEAFKFDDLYRYIDLESEYTELIYHYKKEPKILFYQDFQNNVKLTYKADLDYCRFLMQNKDNEKI